MNTLEQIRIDKGLTYEELGEKIGVKRHVAWKHCQEALPPAEAAIRYSAALEVPLSDLRPDLPTPLCGQPQPGEAPTPEARP